MVPTEYTDRIVAGEAVYLAPNGRFHRPGCRYYVVPGPEATFIEGTFTTAFLANSCKLCFPQGAPAPLATAGPEEAPHALEAPEAAAAAAPTPAPVATAAAAAAPTPVATATAAPTPDAATAAPPPPGAEPERQRRRKKSRRAGPRPPAITKLQVAIFVGVVLSGVGIFVALAALLHWFS